MGDPLRHWATQEDDDDTMERRQSLGTQRSEQALDPGMAAHVVDALFDKCAAAPAHFTRAGDGAMWMAGIDKPRGPHIGQSRRHASLQQTL